MNKSDNKEPNFKHNPIEWLAWNMKTTGNDFKTALTILYQKNIVSNF